MALKDLQLRSLIPECTIDIVQENELINEPNISITTKNAYTQTSFFKIRKNIHKNCNICICNDGRQSMNFWKEYTGIYYPKQYSKKFQIPKFKRKRTLSNNSYFTHASKM